MDYFSEKYQSNLLKNINSSLLDNEEKNKLLKVYMDLQDVGKSLYRYNVLKKNNHLAAAEEEKEGIEQLINYAENLRQELTDKWNESVSAVKVAIDDLNNKYWQKVAEIEEEGIMMQWKEADNLFGDALKNMYDLRQDVGIADKFYHAKAHCEVAQRESKIQSEIMTQAGNIRESGQFIVHTFIIPCSVILLKI